jgi:hypothetical protein
MISDEELINAVAVEVMGWQRKYIEVPFFVPDSFINKTVMRSFWFDGEINEISTIQFDPITNANHWMRIVEKMRELGFYLCFDALKTGYGARFWLYGLEPTPLTYISDRDPGKAVCLAAIDAIGVIKDD